MERRHQSRSRTLKSARILLNHHQSVIDCVVRNLSPIGACLKVETTFVIPDRFDVIFGARMLAQRAETPVRASTSIVHPRQSAQRVRRHEGAHHAEHRTNDECNRRDPSHLEPNQICTLRGHWALFSSDVSLDSRSVAVG